MLGAAVWPGGIPSPTLRRRIEWAVGRFQSGGFDRLLLSGGLGRNPPAEADVMARIAIEAGVPAAAILYDRAASTTYDTARFAAALPGARAAAFTAVTDRYHAPRTWLAFRAFGLRVALSCPPGGAGTRRASLLRSCLREAPALILYAGYFLRERLARTEGTGR